MSNATFHNFSSKPFTGYWNGKAKTFKPGERVYMPEYLAEHFAKHLTNRTLIEEVSGGENYTSPKRPADVPQFMEIFKKAFIADDAEQGNELEQEIAAARTSAPSSEIHVVQPKPINHGPAAALAEAAPEGAPLVISVPDGDEDEGFAHGDKPAA